MIKKGALIKLRAFGGKYILRRVVGKSCGAVLICSDKEFKFAKKQGREPLCVGFPIKDVIGTKARRFLSLQQDFPVASKDSHPTTARQAGLAVTRRKSAGRKARSTSYAGKGQT
jgi:hypothetical protein